MMTMKSLSILTLIVAIVGVGVATLQLRSDRAETISTTGDNSPIVTDAAGNVTITLD